jgi:hypothetical protein
VVEVNPNPTEQSHYAQACLRAPSGVALPALVERVLELAEE